MREGSCDRDLSLTVLRVPGNAAPELRMYRCESALPTGLLSMSSTRMNVSIIGSGQHADVRQAAIETRLDVARVTHRTRVLDWTDPDPDAIPPDELFDDTDVAFVTVPTASHYHVAQAAARHGVHLFLEWPPATSIRECESIVQLAEEASVEVGISRPLRFHPLFDILGENQRIHLIVLRQEVDTSTPAFWPPRCADALDLCCALARSHSIQRIDAEAVPRHAAWPEAVAFALRFHSGTYAQVSLYRRQQPDEDLLYVAGANVQLESNLDGTTLAGHSAPETSSTATGSPIGRETHAFLDAIAAGQIPPVTVLDGLHTMRLVERLMEQLR